MPRMGKTFESILRGLNEAVAHANNLPHGFALVVKRAAEHLDIADLAVLELVVQLDAVC